MQFGASAAPGGSIEAPGVRDVERERVRGIGRNAVESHAPGARELKFAPPMRCDAMRSDSAGERLSRIYLSNGIVITMED